MKKVLLWGLGLAVVYAIAKVVHSKQSLDASYDSLLKMGYSDVPANHDWQSALINAWNHPFNWSGDY